jgi:hypothetical protein
LGGEYLFGYGALVSVLEHRPTRDPHPHGWVTDLPGHRRVWGVAMDNTRDLPGYKYFVDPRDGSRPAVFVAFLDIVEEPEGLVNGLLAPVGAEDLEALDARERNYRRTDISASFPAVDGVVWTYTGLGESRDRMAHALAEHRARIARPYLDHVRGGFEELAAAELDRFDRGTEAPPCRVVDLERRDLPPGRPA